MHIVCISCKQRMFYTNLSGYVIKLYFKGMYVFYVDFYINKRELCINTYFVRMRKACEKYTVIIILMLEKMIYACIERNYVCKCM